MSVIVARDRFRARMEEAFKLLVALDAAVNLGTLWMKDNVAKYPDATVHTGVGPPTATKVMTRPFPMSDAVQVLQARPQLTTELVHGLVIQWWYDFLQEAFEALLRAHLNGTKPCPKFERVDLRLEAGGGMPLLDAVVAGAARDFSFEPAHERLPKPAKVLGAKLNADNVALQRRHILLRNVIEHAGGVLRPDDLRPLGTSSIELLNADHDPVTFKAGDRLVLTVWEAVRPVRHLAELADELVAAS